MKKLKATADIPSPCKTIKGSPSRKRKRGNDSTIVLAQDTKELMVKGLGASTSEVATSTFFRTRMSPKLLLTFIKQHMSDQQKADIQSIGFGGLLMLQTDMVPGFLAFWLVSTFNTCLLSLMDEKLLITEDDVYLSTGIPKGPTEIEIATLYDQNEDFLELKSNWLKQFSDIHRQVKTQEVYDLMITQQQGGDDFKRNFAVFIVSTFLMGVKGTTASLRILKVLGDVAYVSSLNWCGFTLKQLVKAVDSWKKSGSDTANFGGPIMLLVFIYLDRVRFKYEQVPRVFPTLASWSRTAISKRMKEELKVGFGKGVVQPRLVLLPNIDEEPIHIPPGPSGHSGQEPMDTAGIFDQGKKGCLIVKKLVDAANGFAIAYETFFKVLVEAKTERPECNVVRQMVSMAEALSQGDKTNDEKGKGIGEKTCEVKGKGIGEKTCEVKGKGFEKDRDECRQAEDIGSDPLREFAKREFSSEDELLAALLKLEIALGKRPAKEVPKETAREVPEETESVQHFGKQKQAKTTTPRQSPWLTPPIIMPPSFKLLSSESQEGDSPKSPSCERSPQVSPPASPPICISPLSSLPPPVDIMPNKRSRVPTEVFRSPFLQRNVCVVGDLNQSEKEVLEYVFGQSFDDSEILFKNDIHSLTRADLKTILSGEIVAETVTCVWCHILNKTDKSKSRNSPSRFYMPLRFCNPRRDIDDFSGAALIFVPYVCPQPFVFCFNFLKQKLQVLHHMEKNSLNYADHVEQARKFVSTALKKKMPTVQNVFGQSLEEVPKSVIGDEADTGIYLLRLLETYKGDKKDNSSDLHNKQQLKIFGARVCYQIVTFTENRFKDKILYDAHALCPRVGKQNLKIPPPPFPYTDDELLKLVFNNRRTLPYLYEVLVDTKWIKVNREELRTFKKRSWLIDTVIDAVGVMWTLDKPNILYLPVAVKDVRVDSTNNNRIICPYLKMNYMPENASTIDKVFWTINKDNHWFALLSDLNKKEHYILDSLKPRKGKPLIERNEYVAEIVYNVANVLGKENGYTQFKYMVLFETVNVDIPQQSNVHDCGMFVIKSLEAVTTGETLLGNKQHYKNMDAYREYIMLEL